MITRREFLAGAGRQVATVGRLEIAPNSSNVIPGLVHLSVELRDLDPRRLEMGALAYRNAT